MKAVLWRKSTLTDVAWKAPVTDFNSSTIKEGSCQRRDVVLLLKKMEKKNDGTT